MVSCYYCQKELPWGCICEKSDEEKLLTFFSSAQREAKLCEEMVKGKIPEFLVDGEKMVGKVKSIHTRHGHHFEINVEGSGPVKEMILLDSEGKPLYRYRKSIGPEAWVATWILGAGREEDIGQIIEGKLKQLVSKEISKVLEERGG